MKKYNKVMIPAMKNLIPAINIFSPVSLGPMPSSR